MRYKYHIKSEEWNAIKIISQQHCLRVETILFYTFFKVINSWSSSYDNPLAIALVNSTSTNKKIILPEHLVENRFIETCKQLETHINLAGEQTNEKEQQRNKETKNTIAFDYTIKQEQNTQSTINQELWCGTSRSHDGINIHWVGIDEIFCEKDIYDMLKAQEQLLYWIQKSNYEEDVPNLLPKAQIKVRNKINSTTADIPDKLLHQGFFTQAKQNPNNIALLWIQNGISQSMTYKQLSNKALQLAAYLLNNGIKKGELIAVTLPKGPEQIIAVMGILASGAAYLPISVDQPQHRQAAIRNIAKVKCVILDSKSQNKYNHTAHTHFIALKDAENTQALDQPVEVKTDSSAYIIFTSGSTGEPKGVEISHKAAHNTICDVNLKYNINQNDCAIAISSLDFDLSVYDIFGLLSVGGRLALINDNERKEASAWLKLVQKFNVTLWNSVPALFNMLLISSFKQHDLSSLKTILLSGDWIELDLYDIIKEKSPNCKFIALGGATEASIWSNYFHVNGIDPSWKSIPYGTPLSNQKFRVVNKYGSDCPDGVVGELWIGGKGIAKGYLARPNLTQNSFVQYNGETWYKTGDIGKYWPDGNIEFLGRKDQQVKLRGYRIEPGEIELALKKYKGVAQSAALVISVDKTPHLVAAVVGTWNKDLNYIDEINNQNQNQEKTTENTFDKLQKKLIIQFLAQLLNLKKLKESYVNWNPAKSLEIAEDKMPIINMWLQWLKKQKVITEPETLKVQSRSSTLNSVKNTQAYQSFTNNSGYRICLNLDEAEKELQALKSNLEPDFRKEKEALLKVEEGLYKAMDTYKNILKGKQSEVSLLDINTLSPEFLSTIDQGTMHGIKTLAEKINKYAAQSNKIIQIGIFGGRTGLLAEKLLRQIHSKNIHFTVMDSAPSMVDAASKRLKTLEHQISCVKVSETNVPDQYRYFFDVVVGINVFHRYHTVSQGLLTASLMLKNKGTLIALEHYTMAPIALVTSAVLDKAFIDFDRERYQNTSPMLSGNKWMKNLANTGFQNVNITTISGTYTNLIEAQNTTNRPLLQPDQILAFASTLLPNYMVPEELKIIPFMPLSTNGKVNKKAFSTPFSFQGKNTITELPQEGMEQQIASIWKQLLQLDQIGRNQVFFEIGGDSLLATRFLTAVKEQFEVEISLREIFEAPLSTVAHEISAKRKELEEEMELMEEGEI